MFGSDRFTHMPENFRTDPDIWDAFVGDVWAAVLTPLGISRQGTVIEIAPGSSAKIVHALADLGFQGQLHFVEPAAEAATLLLEKCRRFLPAAATHVHVLPLHRATAGLPRHADALLGSHICDDLLLATAEQTDTFAWAKRYSDDVSTPTRTAWQHLAADPGQVAAAQQSVVKVIEDTMTSLQPLHMVLNQYPSATLQQGGLGELNQAAYAILQQMTQNIPATYAVCDTGAALGTLPHYHNPHIGRHVLNPQYWLACKRTT